jgi:hypothetical protein
MAGARARETGGATERERTQKEKWAVQKEEKTPAVVSLCSKNKEKRKKSKRKEEENKKVRKKASQKKLPGIIHRKD